MYYVVSLVDDSCGLSRVHKGRAIRESIAPKPKRSQRSDMNGFQPIAIHCEYLARRYAGRQ